MKTTDLSYLNRIVWLAAICISFHTSCATDKGATDKTENEIPLKERLHTIVNSVPGTVGIGFISDTDTLSINNSVHYPMMSVFKLH